MLHNEWLFTLQRLRSAGEPVAPQNPSGATVEFLGRSFVVTDSAYCLLSVPERKLNPRFAVAEAIWMACGRSDLGSLTRYNSVMRNFSDDGLFLTGAYGPHLRGGLSRVLRKLKEDPLTRQAVLQIPRPKVYYTKDEPCTLSMQFLARHGKLHSICTMRSSDAWLGIPYDVFSFAFFQNCIAGSLGLERGSLTINAGSQHLYDKHRDLVNQVLSSEHCLDNKTLAMPALPGFPPQWLEDVLAQNQANDGLARAVCEGSPWARFGLALLAPNNEQAWDVLAGKPTMAELAGHLELLGS